MVSVFIKYYEHLFCLLFFITWHLCLNSSIKSKDDASSTEEDWDADEKEEEAAEEKKESKTKSPKVYILYIYKS